MWKLTFFAAVLLFDSSLSRPSKDRLYLGSAKVAISFPSGFARSSSSAESPPSLAARFVIPNTTQPVTCQLFANDQLLPSQFNVQLVGINSSSKLQFNRSSTCHYQGLAFFDSLPIRTTCLFSFCRRVRNGLIWLPGDVSSYLSLEAEDEAQAVGDDFVAKFHARGADFFLDPGKASGRILYPTQFDKPSFLKWQIAGLVPPHWLHVRMLALITAESFESSILNKDPEKAVEVVASVFNFVSLLWAQLNVSIHLTEVIIWTDPRVHKMAADDWSKDANEMLLDLATITEAEIWPSRTNADHLAVIRNLNSPRSGNTGILGMAWSSMCKAKIARVMAATLAAQTIEETTITGTILVLASTIAHELGHTFGMHHDEFGINCRCVGEAERPCLMSTHSSVYGNTDLQWAWSNCSVKAMKEFRRWKAPYCLEQLPEFVQNVPPGKAVCGNGIQETGEMCDCGPANTFGEAPDELQTASCPNPKCCNFSTCQLIFPATCATGTCCDTDTCSVNREEKLCRPAKSDKCDVPEYCNGLSPICPPDRYLMTGTPCDLSTDGTCYEGECVSRTDHCYQMLEGGFHAPMAEVAHCYNANTAGNRTNNCGHGWFRTSDANDQIKPCAQDDVECGNIMCASEYEEETTKPPIDIPFWVWRRIGKNCYSIATTTLPDFGHTRDGVLCGNGSRYCLERKCQGKVPQCKVPPCDDLGRNIPGFLPPVPGAAKNEEAVNLEKLTTKAGVQPLVKAIGASSRHPANIFASSLCLIVTCLRWAPLI